MISEKKQVNEMFNIQTSTDRMNYLTLNIQILKEHLRKYGHLTDSEAFDFISNQVKIYERESLKLEKIFL